MTAASARGFVRLEVRDAAGRKLADAKAPSPAGDVVPLALTSGALGSAGALVEVVAATDAMECRHGLAVSATARSTRAPAPRTRPARRCPTARRPAGWTSRWERASGGRSAALVARAHARPSPPAPSRSARPSRSPGFSLDFDAARSAARIAGVPIPAWYAATLYSRAALEILYARFRPRGDARGADARDRGRPPAAASSPCVSPGRAASSSLRSTPTLVRSEASRHSARARATGPSRARVRLARRRNACRSRSWSKASGRTGTGPTRRPGRGAAARARSFPRPPTSSPSKDLAGTGPTRADKTGSIAAEGAPPVSAPRRRRALDARPRRRGCRRSTRCCSRPASPRAAPGGSSCRARTARPRPRRLLGRAAPRRPAAPTAQRETLRRLGARINAPMREVDGRGRGLSNLRLDKYL